MSAVWKFFKKKDNQGPVTCNLCNKSYKTCGNTTNLATHLKVKHHYAYLKLLNMQKPTKSGNENEPEHEDAISEDNENSSNGVDVSISIFQFNTIIFFLGYVSMSLSFVDVFLLITIYLFISRCCQVQVQKK